MAEGRQIGLFTPANRARVEREKEAAVTVIIGRESGEILRGADRTRGLETGRGSRH